MTESCPKKTNIAEISPHLICALCGGYLIDATTIVECLHSFCKTCIVRYLESSKYCPICEVLVHKTRPLQNIRLDHTLQDIVYKLVPGLFQSEMKRRREFYKDHPTVRSAKVRQEQQRHRIIYSADEQFSISLEFCPDGRIRRPSGRKSRRLSSKAEVPERRYLLVPANTTVALLKKFMKLKFALPDKFRVDVFHGKGPLRDHYSMMDVAYIYSWKREGVLQLYYSVYRVPDPLPEIKITEVKDEIITEIADDTGQKTDDTAQKAEDTRPSILFNKATLLGNHSVDRNIPHDLSPLELIATVANDISIQEGRGLKRKTEDAQLYENDDENSSTENRQLQKSIERAIDLCSTSNQGSPASSSGGNATVSVKRGQDTRSESHGTASVLTTVSSENSVRTSSSESISTTNSGSVTTGNSNKSSVSLKTSDKNVPLKEKPKKMDTASQCDPRPKKLKGEGHSNSNNKSKTSNKIQTSNKEAKDVSNNSVTEKKPNVKNETKVLDKPVSLAANGVNIIEQNGACVNNNKEPPALASNVKVTETPKEPQSNSESTKDTKIGTKTINLPNKDQSVIPSSENDVPKSTCLAIVPSSQAIPNCANAPDRTLNTVTKTSSTPAPVKSSGAPKTTSAVQNKASSLQNKIPNTSAVTKTSSTPPPVKSLSAPKTTSAVQNKVPNTSAVTKKSSTPPPVKSSSAPKTTSTMQNKVPNTSAVTKSQNKVTSAQSPSKPPSPLFKSPATPTKMAESVKSLSQINGHSSPSEVAKQQNKASALVKPNQNDKKD